MAGGLKNVARAAASLAEALADGGGPSRARVSAGAAAGGTLARVSTVLTFRLDDLSGVPTRALIARHLAGMHEHSPPGSVFTLDADKLRQPGVTFWSAWVSDDLTGCGALNALDPDRGEIKSMRVADPFLGRGVGRAILEFSCPRRAGAAYGGYGSRPARSGVYAGAPPLRERRLRSLRGVRGLRRRSVQHLHDAGNPVSAAVFAPRALRSKSER